MHMNRHGGNGHALAHETSLLRPRLGSVPFAGRLGFRRGANPQSPGVRQFEFGDTHFEVAALAVATASEHNVEVTGSDGVDEGRHTMTSPEANAWADSLAALMDQGFSPAEGETITRTVDSQRFTGYSSRGSLAVVRTVTQDDSSYRLALSDTFMTNLVVAQVSAPSLREFVAAVRSATVIPVEEPPAGARPTTGASPVP
jgi:hypothetical protein